MKELLLFVWQLPQNILGVLVVVFTGSSYNGDCWVSKGNKTFGVSLGKFIIFGGTYDSKDLLHEKGHQKQSICLGWLYLIFIGIPSVIGNLSDRVLHKDWSHWKREQWYYNQPWEKWADKLGGVKR